ncbi:hypothetical protein HHA03_18190 [Halolactibacillus halophilus]|uniref:Uncharacterized protein n=1 Tax=Halolactibacillus halophilus TaxID=306540 RepID=A0ABQ0VM79_9BACI|nr:hypothetical protein HHA03_18190 [Halolactibacillus halophilus]
MCKGISSYSKKYVRKKRGYKSNGYHYCYVERCEFCPPNLILNVQARGMLALKQ